MTPSDIEKSGKDFEEYVKSLPAYTENMLQKDEEGKYIYAYDRHHFNTWQASRESLVVELPNLNRYTTPTSYLGSAYSYDVKKALQSAGINYTEKE